MSAPLLQRCHCGLTTGTCSCASTRAAVVQPGPGCWPEEAALPTPEHGTRPDVLARIAFVRIAHLRSDTCSKRDEVATAISDCVESLARLAAQRDELLALAINLHNASDMLMALLISTDTTFRPTKSAAWPLIEGSAAIIKRAGGKL